MFVLRCINFVINNSVLKLCWGVKLCVAIMPVLSQKTVDSSAVADVIVMSGGETTFPTNSLSKQEKLFWWFLKGRPSVF